MCLEPVLHINEAVNYQLIQRLVGKGVSIFLDSDVKVDHENHKFSVMNKSSKEMVLENEEYEFFGYTSFRNWPRFLNKSGLYEEDFDKNYLMHKKYDNVHALGNLINPYSSLLEKCAQARVAQTNLYAKVSFYIQYQIISIKG